MRPRPKPSPNPIRQLVSSGRIDGCVVVVLTSWCGVDWFQLGANVTIDVGWVEAGRTVPQEKIGGTGFHVCGIL